ncbi:hypothetical protein BXO88_02780 [Oribacterium sp. C9]|uniref:helix-turn-helix transcriptional regulator n=1 Tax=Oribacterium sp. C9 TaxID=1943579 RepID=UPI00098F9E0B|nr:hypothetical protein [Oribacterium sp. C9]OON87619.1 hypothetical protein BXO88_02780 [Oribacterium sp. C9]
MKKIVIICDRCGAEIKGYPMKLTADYVERADEKRVDQKISEGIKKALMDDCERDYCEKCMQEILEFAHHNMDLETFVSEKKDELTEEAKIDAKAMVMTMDKVKKILKPSQRDMLEQMYARGMDEKDIARDMGIERYIVRYYIGEIRKAG